MGIVLHKDGTCSPVINGIQQEITDCILANEYLIEKELSITKIAMFVEEEILIFNYILLKKTKEALQIPDIYEIKEDKDEKHIDFLIKLTKPISGRDLDNYQYKEEIKNILNQFRNYE